MYDFLAPLDSMIAITTTSHKWRSQEWMLHRARKMAVTILVQVKWCPPSQRTAPSCDHDWPSEASTILASHLTECAPPTNYSQQIQQIELWPVGCGQRGAVVTNIGNDWWCGKCSHKWWRGVSESTEGNAWHSLGLWVWSSTLGWLKGAYH